MLNWFTVGERDPHRKLVRRSDRPGAAEADSFPGELGCYCKWIDELLEVGKRWNFFIMAEQRCAATDTWQVPALFVSTTRLVQHRSSQTFHVPLAVGQYSACNLTSITVTESSSLFSWSPFSLLLIGKTTDEVQRREHLNLFLLTWFFFDMFVGYEAC